MMWSAAMLQIATSNYDLEVTRIKDNYTLINPKRVDLSLKHITETKPALMRLTIYK